MKKITVLLCLAVSALSVACNDLYCPAGVSKSCRRSCSGRQTTAMNDCWRLYGPQGVHDDVLLSACQQAAEEDYDDCYDSCPCEGEVDPDMGVKVCN